MGRCPLQYFSIWITILLVFFPSFIFDLDGSEGLSLRIGTQAGTQAKACGYIYTVTFFGGSTAFAEEPPKPSATPLERGIQLLNEKKPDEALKAFEEAISLDPQNPLPHYYAGVAYHLKRQPLPAITSLNRALQLAPGMPEAILEIGMIMEEIGRFDQARGAYQAVAAGREENPVVKEARERLRRLSAMEHYRRAGRLFQERRYEDALKELQSALSLTPENAEFHFAAGTAYLRLERFKEALEAFKKAVEINPAYTDAFFQIGLIYESQSVYKEAIEAFKRVISLAPGSSQAEESEKKIKENERRLETWELFEKSSQMILKEQWAEALQETQAILAIEPKNPNALFNLGLILYKLNDTDGAIEALKDAIAVDPKFQKAYRQLGVIYDDLGRFREAVEHYEQAVALGGTGPEVEKVRERVDLLKPLLEMKEMAAEARELLEKKDIAGAIKEVETITLAKRDDPRLFLTLATLYLQGGRLRDAASALEKAASLSPGDKEIWYPLARIYEGLKEYQKAVEAYRTVASLEGETPRGLEAREKMRSVAIRLHFDSGRRLLEKGVYEEALKEIQAVLEISPEDPVALFNLGVLYDRLNRQEEAEPPLRKAIELAPDYVQAHLQLGLVLEKMRKFEEARGMYQKVLEIQKEGREARIAGSRIEIMKEQEALFGHIQRAIDLVEEKEYEGARKEIEAVVALNPRNYIGYFYLGIIMDRMGILDEARVAFKKAIEINPRYARAYLALGDILFKEGDFEEARKAYQQVIDMGKETPEAEVAVTRLRELRRLTGRFSMTQSYNSNIAFGAKAQWALQSGYSLGLNYLLLRAKEWNLTASLSASETIYYRTQLQGNGYGLSLSGGYQFPGERALSGAVAYNKGYFEGKPTSVQLQVSGDARVEPRTIPTSLSLHYGGSRVEVSTNRASSAVRHNLSLSISQKVSLKDTLTGSYSFGTQRNLDLLGSNYANRSHTLSLGYGRPLWVDASGSLGYSISLVNYSNPDSTTFFQRFRRNVNQNMSAGLSLRLSERVSFSLNYSYAISRTNLPRPTAEDLRELEDILASPIPTVGGGYRQHNASFTVSTTF